VTAIGVPAHVVGTSSRVVGAILSTRAAAVVVVALWLPATSAAKKEIFSPSASVGLLPGS
jgi:hypothetical protein